jgi:hypothetical protein
MRIMSLLKFAFGTFLFIAISVNVKAQTPMVMPAPLNQTSEPGAINISVNPFQLNALLDSLGLLHTRMALGIEGGSITGMSQGLTVESTLYSKGTLQIDGASELNSTLSVAGATTLAGLTSDGQLVVKGNAAGSYAVPSDGSNLDNEPAILIQLDGTTAPHRNTNFMEFHSGELALGRVEGQNMTQEWITYGSAFQDLLTSGVTALASTAANTGMSMLTGATSVNDNQAAYDVFSNGQSPEDGFNNVLGVFTTDFGMGLVDGSLTIVKDCLTAIVQIWGCCYLGAGCDDIVGALIDLLDDSVSLSLHVYGSYGWTGDAVGAGGIAFESGGADYAEWLEKNNYEEFLFSGDVVGVNGGKVSKSFETAERFMVISTNPTVVGAMPTSSIEQNFVRVAFMGQVPTKVAGVVQKGDFILPSGNNDGLAIGVAPVDMKTSDYKRIIGTAWQESEANKIVSIINVAVGLNDNLLAAQVEKLESTLNRVESAISALDPTYEVSNAVAEANSSYTSRAPVRSKIKEKMIAQANLFTKNEQEKKDQMSAIFASAQIMALESGVDLTSFPYLAEVFADPLNVELRQEAKAYFKERQVQLSSIQRSLKSGVEKQSKESSVRGDGVSIDPYFMLKSSNK